MSETLRRVQTLVLSEDVRVSDHAYDELRNDAIDVLDALTSIVTAIAVEDYPDRFGGRRVLTLQRDRDSRPIHIVWAVPAGERRPAILVTAYRPDPNRWQDDLKRRHP